MKTRAIDIDAFHPFYQYAHWVVLLRENVLLDSSGGDQDVTAFAIEETFLGFVVHLGRN
jgi:hypothetical protein